MFSGRGIIPLEAARIGATAVGCKDLPSHPAGLGTGQKPQGAGKVIGLAPAAHRDEVRIGAQDLGILEHEGGAFAAGEAWCGAQFWSNHFNIYLRKNGEPYSGNAELTEYYDRTNEPNRDSWLIVTTIIYALGGAIIGFFVLAMLPHAAGAG